MSYTDRLLERNHGRLNAILLRIRDFCELDDWPNVSFETSQFSSLLDFEINQEEDVLFPAYQSKTDIHDSLLEELSRQHAELRDVMDEMLVAISRRQKQVFEQQFALLNGLIIDHNDKEEELLLAMLGLFGQEEQERLGKRLSDYVLPTTGRH